MIHRAIYFHELGNTNIYFSISIKYLLSHAYLNAIIDWKSEVEAVAEGESWYEDTCHNHKHSKHQSYIFKYNERRKRQCI